jgi:phosphoglycerol transferase MdoB-like AlkP superfamily enzyme
MTTSNHRPYTYPSGKINIPSGSGRDGAVRYTDYAIEQLIKEASQREWFKNTVFVIVADHCAGSARKQELPIKKYEIPLLIYSPTLIPPKVVDTLCSQIDIAPTIFGLLNWSYETKFYGKDILSMMPSDERALFGNYQKVALLKNHTLSVIKPIREFANYHCNLSTGELTEINNDQANLTETLAYYQSAYRNFNSGNMRNFTQLKQSSK